MSAMDSMMDNYMRLPVFSRTVATITFVVSFGGLLGVVPTRYFIYHPFFLFRLPPQLWRLVTNFFLTGPKLGLLFDTYFLYSYLSQLEVGNPRFSRKEDLIWYLTFVCGTILTASYFTDLGFVAFLPALILAMVYTVTQDQRGANVNYMFITMPAQLMPYAMLAINLLFENGVMNLLLQLHGLFAGHLFEFLTRVWPEYGGGRNLIPTPAFLTKVVQTTQSFAERYGRGYLGYPAGAARGSGSGTSGSSGSASRGPLPDSWRTRGPGHRLG